MLQRQPASQLKKFNFFKHVPEVRHARGAATSLAFSHSHPALAEPPPDRLCRIW